MRDIWRKVRFFIILALISALACGTGPAVCAAADGTIPDIGQTGSVSLTLRDANGNAVADGAVTIYEVAVITLEDGSMVYTYTEAFSGTPMARISEEVGLVPDVNDGTLADALAEYVTANEISGIAVNISAEGTLCFDGLELGMYLVVQTTRSTGFSEISPFLVTVPYADGDLWVYDVDASPKVEVISEESDTPGDHPGETPDENPDGNPEDNPEETPEDSPEENPDFPSEPDSPTLPQTGQLNWPVPVLALSGLIFLAVGRVLYLSGGAKSDGAE